MSELSFLNYQRTSSDHHHDNGLTKKCLCCLEKDGTFVNLTNCKHFETLKNLCSVPKIELGRLVCYHCHAKLKTIYDFKLQAEESFNLLWSRQHSATKRTPKLVKEEMYLECQPQDLLMDRISTKSDQNYVNDYKVVVSGCWFNDPTIPPGNETQTDQKISVVTIKREVDEVEVNKDGVDWKSRPRICKISTTVKNYHLEVSGLHLDIPQDDKVWSDLDTNDEPLTMIKREVAIEAPLLQEHEEACDAGKRKFVNIEDNPTNAVVFTKKAVFHCTVCSEEFASKQNLRAHNIEVHNHPEPVVKPKIYKLKDYAGVVKLITLTHEEMMKERETERNSKRYLQNPHQCDLCIVSYDHEQLLKDHNKKHQLIANSFKCDICMSVFEAQHVMKYHEKKHYERYECSVCQERNSSSKAIVDHYNMLHEANNKIKYSCSLCDHTSMTYRSHTYHLEKHKGNNFCLLCSSKYSTKASLRSHMLAVHGKLKERVQCKECDKTYRSQRYLKVHIKSKHAPPSLPAADAYYCASCNKYYKTHYILQAHLKRHRNHVHDDNKKIICDTCNNRFFTKAEIQAHITSLHLKIRSFTCSQCPKSYSSRGGLKVHVKTVHELLRPPKDKMCDYCGQGFRDLKTLRSHIRRHTGERPFQCAHCPSTFAHSAAFYTHNKLLHSGKRKEKCK